MMNDERGESMEPMEELPLKDCVSQNCQKYSVILNLLILGLERAQYHYVH